jgi:hypothetical protein
MWKFEPEVSLDKILQLSVGETTRFTGGPEPDGGFRSTEDRVNGLIAFGDITGISVMELLLLHVIGQGCARRDRLMKTFRSYWCVDGCLVGSYYVLWDYDQRNLEEDSRRAFESLFRRGLIAEGIEGLTPWRPEEGVIDLWDFESYEVHNDSIELTDRGRDFCEHIESNLLELEAGASQVIDDVLCIMRDHPPPFAPTCYQDFHACRLWSSDGVDGPPCAARLVLRWRPTWWQKPRIGYLVLCRNENDIRFCRG